VTARTFSALRNCWLTPREKVTTFEFASPKPRHTISAITWGCEGEGIRSVEGQVQMNQRTWVGDGRGWQGMAGRGLLTDPASSERSLSNSFAKSSKPAMRTRKSLDSSLSCATLTSSDKDGAATECLWKSASRDYRE
jgi:hypothetical protein